MAVERKYERDIDLLLAEEFAVSPAFGTWFLTRTDFQGADARVVDVYVSKSDINGESDLVVLFQEADGGRFALLIEDKIDAPLQPEQEARYRLRGQAAVARGEYRSFEVVLCSPASYPVAQPKAAGFDRFVSYEAISEFLAAHDITPRGAYRANFVATAASRNANTWARTVDDVTNAFWARAYEVAVREFPALEMKERAFTKGNLWVSFRPRDMPTHPQHIYIQPRRTHHRNRSWLRSSKRRTSDFPMSRTCVDSFAFRCRQIPPWSLTFILFQPKVQGTKTFIRRHLP